METYRDFLDRINSFQKSEIDFGNEYFLGNLSIAQKVNKENVFRAFYGDTVVFNLDDSTKEKLTKIVNRINDVASECFWIVIQLLPEADYDGIIRKNVLDWLM